MTDSPEITGLTDDQLIERLAGEVMGWNKVRIDDRELCWAPDMGTPTHRVNVWKPLGDWNHTMEIVEKMRKRKISPVYIATITNGWCVSFGWPKGRNSTPYGEGSSLDLKRAICLAALRGVQSSHA